MMSASLASDRPQGDGMRQSSGVCHVSQIMPLVLARYGLSLEDRADAERPAVTTEANDFFDVSIGALESVLAS